MNLFALTAGGASAYSGIIMMVVMFALFYFMLIRPQKKKDKEIKAMRGALKIGDSVVTIGGVVGKVVKVSDETLDLEVPFGKQRLTIQKWAVGSVISKTSAKEEKKEDKKDVKEIEEKKEDK